MGLLSYFTRHRTVANLLLVLMLAAGVLAFPKMRAQFFPDVVIDSVSVSVIWPGAGAEDVDAAIVQTLEPALLAVEGVTGSSANSTEGRASICTLAALNQYENDDHQRNQRVNNQNRFVDRIH